MEGLAKLITALGTLLGALAWPTVVIALSLIYRDEIRTAFSRIPSFLDRVRKMKIAGVEADLDKVADASSTIQGGAITPFQVETAARIAVDASDYTSDLLAQLDKLTREYDSIRRTMAAGSLRTQAMTRIVVKMRALAPSLVGHIDAYKTSGSAGSRLAAVAIMQMEPSASDLDWLSERFLRDQPFVFYHAALAMQNLATAPLRSEEWDRLLVAAQRSLDTILAFDGTPDGETIEVLEQLISDIRQ